MATYEELREKVEERNDQEQQFLDDSRTTVRALIGGVKDRVKWPDDRAGAERAGAGDKAPAVPVTQQPDGRWTKEVCELRMEEH